MGQTQLVMDEVEAGANLIRAMNHFAAIKVAFWLKVDEEDDRHLYLASERFDLNNRPRAYEELTRIMDRNPSMFIDPLKISLIGGDDRWAVAAQQINDQFADRLGTRLRAVVLGDQSISDAYIYPSPLSPTFPK